MLFLLPLDLSAQRSLVKNQSPVLFRIERVIENLTSANRTSLASLREAEIVFSSATADHAGVSRLTIPLFDGDLLRATRSGTEMRSLDDLTWRGTAPYRDGEAQITLTFKKGFVAGLITTPKHNYEISPKGNKHILMELDASRFPECAGSPEGEPGRQIDLIGPAVDSGDRIDVLVVYTASVRNSVGGDAQAQVLAQQSIDSTNTTYINSRIRQRVRLVGAHLTAITESNLSTELSTLRNDPATAALRNSTNADLVAMLSNSTDACGIGYLMGSPGGNPNNGFTVTARTCAVGNLTFAHELGHNMGSQHNPENGSGATFPYGYGHWHNGVYRTVMSYVNPCTNGCNRAPYFSNPDVIYLGLPTGIAGQRDNVRSINNTADWVANYRYSGSSITLANLTGGEVVRRIGNVTINWNSFNLAGNVRIDVSRDGGTSWQTLIPSTPNDGAETISLAGKPTIQGRIRIVSLNDSAVSDSSVNSFRIQ